MFGLFELELACLWMSEGKETYVLNMKPTRQELRMVRQRVNHQLNGNGKVAIARTMFRPTAIRVNKYRKRLLTQ